MSWQDDAVRLRDEGKQYPEIARLMREEYHRVFSDEQIRAVYRRRKEGQRIQKERITFEDIKVSSEADIEAYLEQVINFQDAQAKLDSRQVDGSLRIDDAKPIGIVHTADWHIGGFGTDLRLLRDDVDRIRDTEGMYSVFLGDAGENYITGAPQGGQFQQLIQPERQYEIAGYLMERLQKTLLAALEGCHDAWSDKQGSHNFIAEVTKNTRTVNLWHGGTLTVNLGDQSYRGHLRHKFRGESQLNPLLPCRRMMEHYGLVDWAALAHKHFCAMQQSQMAGQDVLFVRPGSYKVLDDHGQQIGGYAGLPRTPVIILYPDTHRVDGYRTLAAGIEALQYARR